jgi:hypothetical protein
MAWSRRGRQLGHGRFSDHIVLRGYALYIYIERPLLAYLKQHASWSFIKNGLFKKAQRIPRHPNDAATGQQGDGRL